MSAILKPSKKPAISTLIFCISLSCISFVKAKALVFFKANREVLFKKAKSYKLKIIQTLIFEA
jgi:hypothetical protein